MKKHILNIAFTAFAALMAAACFNLEEEVFSEVDASVYYQDAASITAAVDAIYSQTSSTLAGENFFHLSEYPSDQLTWRVWNGGAWGWDEAEKTVLSWHNWTEESKILNNAWNGAWAAIGLANLLLSDLKTLDPSIAGDALAQGIAEVRTLRAWNYYCLYEIWGGALPLNTSASSVVPGSVDGKDCKTFVVDGAAGLSENLIFNNNGNGTQLGDYALKYDNVAYFFTVSASGVEIF